MRAMQIAQGDTEQSNESSRPAFSSTRLTSKMEILSTDNKEWGDVESNTDIVSDNDAPVKATGRTGE